MKKSKNIFRTIIFLSVAILSLTLYTILILALSNKNSWQNVFSNSKKIKPHFVTHVVDKKFEKNLGVLEYDLFVTRCVIQKTTIDSPITSYVIDSNKGKISVTTSHDDDGNLQTVDFRDDESRTSSITYIKQIPNHLFIKGKNGEYTSFFDYRNSKKEYDGIFDVMYKNVNGKRDKYIRFNNKWLKGVHKNNNFFANGKYYKFNKDKSCWEEILKL